MSEKKTRDIVGGIILAVVLGLLTWGGNSLTQIREQLPVVTVRLDTLAREVEQLRIDTRDRYTPAEAREDFGKANVDIKDLRDRVRRLESRAGVRVVGNR